MESLNIIMLWIFALTALISFFGILVQGFNDQLVIYKNKTDFWRVVLTLLSGLILTGLLNRAPGDEPQMDIFLNWIVTPVVFIVTLILVIDNFILCIRQNNHRIIVGSLITIYRYFYIMLALLLLIRIIDGNGDKRRSSGQVVLGIMGATAVGYGIYRLINGDRVEKLRNNSANN